MEVPVGAEVKPWGWSLPVWSQTYVRPDDEIGVLCRGVRVFINAGGFSSIHLHRYQQNLFFVKSGVLQLRDFIMDGSVPVPIGVPFRLGADDRPLTFNEGVPHQFLAETDVEALEIYFAVAGHDSLPGDIERFSENGPQLTVDGIFAPEPTRIFDPTALPPALISDVRVYGERSMANLPRPNGKYFIQPGSVESP